MSLDFDGTNDVVSLASVTLGDTITIVARFDADDQGSGDSGRISIHGVAGSHRHSLHWDGNASSEKVGFDAAWSTGFGQWAMTTGFAAVTGHKAVAVTYDFGATSNNPILYTLVDGVLATLTVGAGLTELLSPSGTAPADGGTLRVGLTSASLSDFNGRIGEYAAWTRILSPAEIAAVFYVGAMAAPGMYVYWPLGHDGSATALDFSGNARAGTVSGAVNGVNPPIRPGGRRG